MAKSRFGFWAVPYLGFSLGKWENAYTDNVVNIDGAGDTTALRYGLSTGMLLWKYFYLGGSAEWSNHSWRYNDAEGLDYDDSFDSSVANQKSYGAVAGVRLTKRAIFWFGYDFKNELSFNENINPNIGIPTYTGKALKFGVSMFRKKSFTTLSYQIDKFDELTIDGETSGLPGTVGTFEYGEYKHSAFVLTIGIPIGRLKK